MKKINKTIAYKFACYKINQIEDRSYAKGIPSGEDRGQQENYGFFKFIRSATGIPLGKEMATP